MIEQNGVKWRTQKEVAEMLGISKEVVKYHKKKISEENYAMGRAGTWYINEKGVEEIQEGLRKPKEWYSITHGDLISRKIDDLSRDIWAVEYALEKILERLEKLEKKIDGLIE